MEKSPINDEDFLDLWQFMAIRGAAFVGKLIGTRSMGPSLLKI
jgi:hypothetical protein